VIEDQKKGMYPAVVIVVVIGWTPFLRARLSYILIYLIFAPFILISHLHAMTPPKLMTEKITPVTKTTTTKKSEHEGIDDELEDKEKEDGVRIELPPSGLQSSQSDLEERQGALDSSTQPLKTSSSFSAHNSPLSASSPSSPLSPFGEEARPIFNPFQGTLKS